MSSMPRACWISGSTLTYGRALHPVPGPASLGDAPGRRSLEEKRCVLTTLPTLSRTTVHVKARELRGKSREELTDKVRGGREGAPPGGVQRGRARDRGRRPPPAPPPPLQAARERLRPVRSLALSRSQALAHDRLLPASLPEEGLAVQSEPPDARLLACGRRADLFFLLLSRSPSPRPHFTQLRELKQELGALRVAKVTGGAPNKLSKM